MHLKEYSQSQMSMDHPVLRMLAPMQPASQPRLQRFRDDARLDLGSIQHTACCHVTCHADDLILVLQKAEDRRQKAEGTSNQR